MKNIPIKYLFVLSTIFHILFSFLIPISSEVYYVSNSGSNSNSGDPGEPWETIQYAAKQLDAGDTVFVETGTYKETVTSKEDGESDKYIVFKANGRVVMNGFQIKHEYVVIDGFEITDWKRNFGIQLTRSSAFCQVRNNLLYHKGEKIGISVWGEKHLVENNEIKDLSCDAFRIFGNGHLIRRNYIHDFKDLGTCHVDVFQSFAENGDDLYNIVFEQNYVENFEGQIFMIDNINKKKFENITVRNNVYINVKSAGQSYIGPIYVYNNTFVNSGFGNSWGIILRYDPKRGDPYGSEIKNNIFYNCGNLDQNKNGWYKAHFTHQVKADFNLVFPKKAGFVEQNGLNGEDPLFNSDSTFRLMPSSPAIDKGIKIMNFETDKDNNSRQEIWDIGAYEYIPEKK